MKTIRQLLEGKGHDVLSATPSTSVYEALELMALAFAADHEVSEASTVLESWGSPELVHQ